MARALYALSIGRVAGWYVAEAGSYASHAEAERRRIGEVHLRSVPILLAEEASPNQGEPP
jgi:hypothetical protein